MCSLFLPRSDFWLYNGHPSGGPWESYGMEDAAAKLRERGGTVRVSKSEEANLKAWQRMLPGGITIDVFALNSKGNVDFFDLFSGTATPYETPVLNQPVAIHLLHSWSMQYPSQHGSVGGRWLSHGAYARGGIVLGAVSECLCAAFAIGGAMAGLRAIPGGGAVVGWRRSLLQGLAHRDFR